MSYPYTKNLRHFTDLRPVPAMNKLHIEGQDHHGKKTVTNVLDFDAANLYNLLNEVYNLGKSDKANEIRKALEL